VRFHVSRCGRMDSPPSVLWGRVGEGEYRDDAASLGSPPPTPPPEYRGREQIIERESSCSRQRNSCKIDAIMKIRLTSLAIVIVVAASTLRAADDAPWKDQPVLDTSKSPHAILHGVPVSAVKLHDGFWAARRKVNVEVSRFIRIRIFTNGLKRSALRFRAVMRRHL
jgi:hypothetical protein